MRRKREPDAVDVARGLYDYVRGRTGPIIQARAHMLWQRRFGARPTTFYAASSGAVWRNDTPALIAELRLLLLRAGFHVLYLRKFDR